MHIPDGFLSPQTWIPAWGVAAASWAWGLRGLRQRLDDQTVPRLALLTALTYGLGLIMLPLPGGTSAHAVGVGLLALIFGVRLAFLAYSAVLVLQALLFGTGGMTALPVNALAVGLVGASVAVAAKHALRATGATTAVIFAAWLSVVVPAILVALVLGLQPLIAQRGDGTPLFFPFGVELTLPAVVLPHLILGAGEAALTLAVWRFAVKRRWSA